MKTIRNLMVGILCACGLVAGWHLLHAQEATASNPSAAPDSIVQITAEAQNLPLVAPAALPRYATFWVMVPGYGNNLMALPYPCMPAAQEELPVYAITGNEFLVDGTGRQVFASARAPTDRATVTEALALQANTVANLIAWIQGVAVDQPV